MSETAGGSPRLRDAIVSAETLIDDGDLLPSADPHRGCSLKGSSCLVRLAPSVESLPSLWPPPPWVSWEHDEDGVWPWPDDSMPT
jgi:hypothetical protein